ncbi:DUF3800 domain-containing protein [Flagellimonas pelagia]|uniref:DUF3800 domain-containing protein n=1 Tax=Flagellimonas pelagia TaxID=2306998 RepID=A0A3A1NGI3_9FLAO|nr:DUF3800 domain-containing protein [Allomuricauda maritima]RIV43583.1 DUF3800 domain-containing protein [Allomuricauda maritima]TXJ93200.1 DUF3800 domain-containing protein [Allomuricauda maritima]
MIKWFADDTKLSTKKGDENNVLLFGGVIVDTKAEQELIDLFHKVKNEYTFPDLPVKWNFKDLKKTYQEFGKEDDYNLLLNRSNEWRTKIFKESKNINYRVIIACLERYESQKKLKEVKDELINISFAQSLMRVGLYAKYQDWTQRIEIILDWPEGSNPKPFNREYYYAFNRGESAKGIKYLCGPLKNLGFNQSVYFTKCTHSAVLQFSDLVIGAAKDFVLKTIYGHDYSLGYDLTKLILNKYNGFPNKIIERGLNYSPKNNNYTLIESELKNNAV